MRAVFANILVTAMAVTYFLLATQAEPVTAFLGYVFGTLLSIAVIASTIKIGNTSDARES